MYILPIVTRSLLQKLGHQIKSSALLPPPDRKSLQETSSGQPVLAPECCITKQPLESWVPNGCVLLTISAVLAWFGSMLHQSRRSTNFSP